MPYLKSEALLRGFVPTYQGELELVSVRDPNKEVVGYKDGDYGRAVTRADTSTIWESRRKRENGGCED